MFPCLVELSCVGCRCIYVINLSYANRSFVSFVSCDVGAPSCGESHTVLCDSVFVYTCADRECWNCVKDKHEREVDE